MRVRTRAMVKGGRVVYAPESWGAYGPVWPKRAMLDADGKVVWVDRG